MAVEAAATGDKDRAKVLIGLHWRQRNRLELADVRQEAGRWGQKKGGQKRNALERPSVCARVLCCALLPYLLPTSFSLRILCHLSAACVPILDRAR